MFERSIHDKSTYCTNSLGGSWPYTGACIVGAKEPTPTPTLDVCADSCANPYAQHHVRSLSDAVFLGYGSQRHPMEEGILALQRKNS